MTPDERPEPEQPESAADRLPAPEDDPLEAARERRHLRLALRPLAYCRPDNDNGRRR